MRKEREKRKKKERRGNPYKARVGKGAIALKETNKTTEETNRTKERKGGLGRNSQG